MTWLHATPADNCPAIERQGLRHHTWTTEPVPESRQRMTNAIHLANVDMSDLVGFCHDDGDDEDLEIALYEVSVQGLPTEAVTPGWDDDRNMLAVYCTIPPSNLTRIR